MNIQSSISKLSIGAFGLTIAYMLGSTFKKMKRIEKELQQYQIKLDSIDTENSPLRPVEQIDQVIDQEQTTRPQSRLANELKHANIQYDLSKQFIEFTKQCSLNIYFIIYKNHEYEIANIVNKYLEDTIKCLLNKKYVEAFQLKVRVMNEINQDMDSSFNRVAEKLQITQAYLQHNINQLFDGNQENYEFICRSQEKTILKIFQRDQSIIAHDFTKQDVAQIFFNVYKYFEHLLDDKDVKNFVRTTDYEKVKEIFNQLLIDLFYKKTSLHYDQFRYYTSKYKLFEKSIVTHYQNNFLSKLEHTKQEQNDLLNVGQSRMDRLSAAQKDRTPDDSFVQQSSLNQGQHKDSLKNMLDSAFFKDTISKIKTDGSKSQYSGFKKGTIRTLRTHRTHQIQSQIN